MNIPKRPMPPAAEPTPGPERAAAVVVPRSRSVIAMAIRGVGLIVGVAAVLIYGDLVWELADEGRHDQRVRGALFLIFLVPIFLLFGPLWLADRLAAHIDRRRLMK